MSIAAAARKTGTTDLYRTPYKAIVPLKMALSNTRNKRILDPCEGDGRIREAIQSVHHSNKVTGMDLYPSVRYVETLYQSPFDMISIGLNENFDNVNQGEDFLNHKEKYDIIAGNPPFSLKGDFIEHGLSISEYVIYILPMSVVSYNIFHRNFLNIPEYVGRILMTPKMFMNADGSFKTGGTDSYAWFIWKNGNNTIGSFEYYFDLRTIEC